MSLTSVTCLFSLTSTHWTHTASSNEYSSRIIHNKYSSITPQWLFIEKTRHYSSRVLRLVVTWTPVTEQSASCYTQTLLLSLPQTNKDLKRISSDNKSTGRNFTQRLWITLLPTKTISYGAANHNSKQPSTNYISTIFLRFTDFGQTAYAPCGMHRQTSQVSPVNLKLKHTLIILMHRIFHSS